MTRLSRLRSRLGSSTRPVDETDVATFDFVVVGAGSAGAVVASRLSENPSRRVLLLEAGGRGNFNPWLRLPIGYAKTFFSPKYNWRYRGAPEPHLGGREIYHPRGKVVGGSSAINGLIFIRGFQSDFDQWRQLGNAGWSYEDVLPFFRKLESNMRGEESLHGRDGPIGIGDVGWRNELSDAYIASAVASGLPRNDDFNGADQEGVGYLPLTQSVGRRNSTASGYLRPAAGRSNLCVVAHAMVEAIDIEEGRALGVVYKIGDRRMRAVAGNEVIVCAGAIGTPQLLQLSGIGSGDLLASHGVPLKHSLPGVGENLQDHYFAPLSYRINKPLSLNDRLGDWPGRVVAALQYAARRDGPLSVGASTVGAFLRSEAHIAEPDLQIHWMGWTSERFKDGVDKHSGFHQVVNQSRPESRGHVRIRTSDPRDHPLIVANYLQTENDCRVTVAGLKMARKVCQTPPISSYITGEQTPGSDVRTDDDLLTYARAAGQSVFHLAGSCRMGPLTDRTSVVDERLRVHGIRGLRVVDASIMPRLVSANTNATSIMIGEKGANMIAEDATA